MSEQATLIGFDFGTTTSRAAVASATIARNAVSGRMELSSVTPRYQSAQVFTPLVEDRLDEVRLSAYLDEWLAGIDLATIFGGGAVVTGLAASRSNAAAFAAQVRRRLKDAVVAIAEDPRLESWLAFMGNCAELSKAHPERMFLNLDIGGGTTNVALGQDGEVLRTGSFYVGARHVEVVPGSYRIVRLSRWAQQLFQRLAIRKCVGDELAAIEVQAIIDWQLQLLADVIAGRSVTDDPTRSLHVQASLMLPPEIGPPAVTLSGGVGQLVYSQLQGRAWPDTTAFGDLGIDLAQGIVGCPFWRDRLHGLMPTTLGRATVFGLLRYHTQISGSTLHLGAEESLPLSDLVIVGSAGPSSSPAQIDEMIGLAAGTAHGGCLRIELERGDLDEIRRLATHLQQALARRPPARVPLVLLMRHNRGKVFGQYLTRWSTDSSHVIVIDEIDAREAQFVHLGALRHGVVPVSFYGASLAGGS